MEWKHIEFRRNKGYIILPQVVAKKQRRRSLPLHPNRRQWLAPFEGWSGRICHHWSTPQTVLHAWDRGATKRKLTAGENRFRNRCISSRVAETSDPAKVALQTGNSAAVILEDYLKLAISEDAARWFKASPSAPPLKALTG